MRTPVTVFCLILLLAGIAPAYDSLNVRLVGRLDSLPDESTCGVAAQGGYAYVADNSAGLCVISVADAAHPTEVGRHDTPGNAADVTVVGDLAYVADGDSGLRIVSVADPTSPVEVGHCATPGYAVKVVVVGDLAYVAHDSGVSMISVADPVHPSEIGRYDNRYGALGVAVDGAYAYVCNDKGLWVVSISDPTHPTWVARYVTSCIDVAIQDSYAYVGAGGAGLRVVSIADPENPIEVGFLADSAEAVVRLAVSGHYVYVVHGLHGTCGLRVISVADPANPIEVGFHKWGNHWVTLSGNYAYCTNNASLVILQFYGEGVEEAPSAEVQTLKCASTVVRGVLFLLGAASPKPTAASLLDISGRKVMNLTPGANDVSRLAPGVYFVHEAQAQAQAVTKVIVAR